MAEEVVITGRTRPRVKVIERKVDGILSYDKPNDYAQRILYTIAASGTASSVVDLYRDYVYGLGFRNESFGKTVLNRLKHTANDTFYKCAEDYSRLAYCIVGVIYNAFYDVVERIHIPAEFMRFCIPDENGVINKIAIYEDWNCKVKSQVKRDKIQYLHLYNPDKEVVKSQIDEVGGFQNYGGQIMFISRTSIPEYPLSPIDPIFCDVETDGLIQVFKNRTVTKGFMPNGMLKHPGKFAKPEDRQKFIDEMMEYQGAENSNSILLVEYTNPDMVPDFTPMVYPGVDKVFELTEKTVKENIIQKFRQPPLLLSKLVPAGLGDNKQWENSKLYYDEITAPDRKLFVQEFTRLCSSTPQINPDGDFSIISSGETIAKAGSNLFKSLGAEAVAKIIEIISSTLLTYDQKLGILVISFGLTKEQISEEKLLVQNSINPAA